MLGGFISLLTEADETGAGDLWPGGKGAFTAWGTFDSATAKLQVTPDGGTTWIDVPDSSLTAAGYKLLDLPPLKIRAAIASAGGSTSLSARLDGAG